MVISDDLVALDNSIDFLKIYDGGRPYYGGAQKWFNDDILKRVGCSIVAAANITAYIAYKYKNRGLFDYTDMSKDNFLHHMEEIAEFIHPDPVYGVTSENYFAEGVSDYARTKNILLCSKSITIKQPLKDVRKFIKDALVEDKPVALLMLKNDVLKEFDWHWMTVTKLFENGDRTCIHVSSWGERRAFELEDFYNYSSYGALVCFDVLSAKEAECRV